MVAPAEHFRPRDRHVLLLHAAGLKRNEIAAREYLSVNTVKTYFNRIHAMLGSHTLAQAVARALAMGEITTDDLAIYDARIEAERERKWKA